MQVAISTKDGIGRIFTRAECKTRVSREGLACDDQYVKVWEVRCNKLGYTTHPYENTRSLEAAQELAEEFEKLFAPIGNYKFEVTELMQSLIDLSSYQDVMTTSFIKPVKLLE